MARRARDKAYSIGMYQVAREVARLTHVIRKLDPLDDRYLLIFRELANRCGYSPRLEVDANITGETITPEMRLDIVKAAAERIARDAGVESTNEIEGTTTNGNGAVAH